MSKKKNKPLYKRIRVPVLIPPGQIFEDEKNPRSRAKMRQKAKNEIKEGMKDM